MSEESERKRWAEEFAALGASGVRSAMVVGRWPAEKRAFARQWLERRDVAEWQAESAGGGLSRFRGNRRIWGIITGIAFGGFALIRVLSRMKAGF